jgi:hypothetical protein
MLRNPFATLRSWLKFEKRKRSPRRRVLRLHALESRLVPDATAVFAGGVLTVTGDSGAVDDDLSVELLAGKVTVFRDATDPGLKTAIPIGGAPIGGLTVKSLAATGGIVVNAGDGNDTVFISSTIAKQAVLNGGLGDDNLTGGAGNDMILGGDGVDSLTGGRGNDTITGGAGDGIAGDVLIGNEGDDSLTGGADIDDIFGGDGKDFIDGAGGDDRLRGDDPLGRRPGNDTILGGEGDDIIVAGKGDDSLNGGDGNDVIEAGDGKDTVTGGADSDPAFAGPDDPGAGEADADSLYGGLGNDLITGGWGNDEIYGEAGNDVLVGGVGQDSISGGLGQDRFTGHGATGGNTGAPELEGNFDTYRDEFDLTRPIHRKAEPKDVAPTELGIEAALAGLAAVANKQSSFSIASRIRYLGTGEYLVKLGPDEETNPDPGSPNAFGWLKVEFDGTWTDNDPMPSAQERFPRARDSREFWTILLHRAVTQSFNNTYDPLTHYEQAEYEGLDSRLTDPGSFIEGLTGASPTSFSLSPTPPDGFTFADIKENLSLGFWLCAEASATATLDGIEDGQAYAITRVATIKGVNYITLYNPSGFDRGSDPLGAALDQTGKAINDGFITISAADFFANFVNGHVN